VTVRARRHWHRRTGQAIVVVAHVGIHFRDAMDDGRELGRLVADHVVAGWFTPAG
jgi:hypothetical protein